MLCFLWYSGQGSPLSPSASRNTQGNWSISDLRSYMWTDCEWGWTPRKGREQGRQQEPRERGNIESCRGRKSFPEKKPGRIGNKVDKGQGAGFQDRGVAQTTVWECLWEQGKCVASLMWVIVCLSVCLALALSLSASLMGVHNQKV